MPMDQEQVVATGLETLAPQTAPMPTTAVAASVETVAPVNTAPVNIVGLGDDVVRKVYEVNQVAAVVDRMTAERAAHLAPPALTGKAPDYDPELYTSAHDENLKRDFLEAVGQRNSFNNAGGGNNPPPYIPPPIPERVAEQTRLEMEAGKRHVDAAAERDKQYAHLRQANQERDAAKLGGTKAVFVPDDYVPKMHQGHIPTQTNRVLG